MINHKIKIKYDVFVLLLLVTLLLPISGCAWHDNRYLYDRYHNRYCLVDNYDYYGRCIDRQIYYPNYFYYFPPVDFNVVIRGRHFDLSVRSRNPYYYYFDYYYRGRRW